MNTFRKLIACASLITISFGAVSCTSLDSGSTAATETITATKLAEHDMDNPEKTIDEEPSEEDEHGRFVIDRVNFKDLENSVVKNGFGDRIGEYYFTLEDGAKLRCIVASGSGVSCNWDYALRKLEEEQNATGAVAETTASTEETEASTSVETSAEETSTTAEEEAEKEAVTVTVTAEAK